MIKLSVVVPSIRPQNWIKLYQSMPAHFGYEIIFIGPEPYITFLSGFHLPIVKYIKSFRSPNACQQQGLMAARGEYITFAADDGVFLRDALNQAMRLIESEDCMMADNYKRIIVGKYLEGDKPNPDMEKEDYYKFGYHKAYQLKGVPQDGLIFNCGIISRQFMLELGGWDAQNFDCTTVAHADLGIRACMAGAEMILMDNPMFQCSHLPWNTGDHGPINRAMKRDLKNFAKIYERTEDRIHIPLDSWQRTEPVWKERFK